jgi:glycosyltransferase involved in cell wall biosynthesis
VRGARFKIVIVLDYLELGGAERQAIYLAEYFHQSEKYEVSVVGFRNKGKAYEILIEKGIKCDLIPLNISNRKKEIVKNCLKLLQYFWQHKPFAIIPYTYWSNLLCGITWRFTKAKVCIWNQRDEGRNVRKSLFEKLSLKNVSHVVSNSLEGKQFLVDNFNIKANRISIIHNGVALSDPVYSVEEWHSNTCINDDTFVVSMVANLHSYKDHITLLRAWKIFTQSQGVEDAKLILAGRLDEMHFQLKSLAFDLGLHDSVMFYGSVEDISGFLSVTDLIAFSSKYEGCPNGILEGMKAAKAVVATDITGTREALGKDYLHLAMPDNEQDLARKILYFYKHPEKLSEVGEQNKSYVDENFSIEGMLKKYEDLINIANKRLINRDKITTCL